tara:strand:- start:1238 stop:2218 length:981 start_codon:yes stop_codon:yes gene_type:complete
MKRIVFSFFIILALIALEAIPQETVTLTTYYPVPFGVYSELRSRHLAIGQTYSDSNAHPWSTTSPPPAGEIDPSADLVVEGNTGIGTLAPSARLHLDNQGSTTDTVAIFDDSTFVSGPWNKNIAFAQEGTQFANIGISGGVSGGNPQLSEFYIDISSTASDDDFIIDLDGNVGLSEAVPRVHPDGVSADGIIDVNDVYLRSIPGWVSQFTPSTSNVYTLNSSRSAIPVNDPAFIVGEQYITRATSPFFQGVGNVNHSSQGTEVLWLNNPFTSPIHAYFTNARWPYGVMSNNLYSNKLWAMSYVFGNPPSPPVPNKHRSYFFGISTE